MEIKISATPKEIADLALVLQNQQNKNIKHDDVIQKQIKLLSEASENCTCMNKGNPENGKALASLTHALISLYSCVNSPDKVDFDAAQKMITEASKKVHEEKSIPKYETREFHIFCGNKTDSDLQKQQVKERTLDDVKKGFEKTLRDLGLSKN